MTALTWEDVRTFDDCVIEAEKEIIRELEREERPSCPCLQKDGSFFYYCGKDMPEIEDSPMSPFNPVYQRHVDAVLLQMHCMSEFGTCCFYSGQLKR